jgi:hypothetical protein
MSYSHKTQASNLSSPTGQREVIRLPDKRGGLKGSTQRWLEVCLQERIGSPDRF